MPRWYEIKALQTFSLFTHAKLLNLLIDFSHNIVHRVCCYINFLLTDGDATSTCSMCIHVMQTNMIEAY